VIKRRLAVGVFAAVVLAAGPAAAATQTQATIYSAFAASGSPAGHVTGTLRGHCWSGSLATERQDAWRCLSGNLIYDPCFSSANAKGIVLCPATGPWSASTIEIKLTSKLPANYGNKGKPSTSGLPWALVTTQGWKCRLTTGASTVVDGKRANYFCTGTADTLWGAPTRASQPWKIYVAPNGAKKLKRKVAISSAWF
jgi:hypothetical protein